jgi:hypothetical protein
VPIPDGAIRYAIACSRCKERKVVRCEHDSRTPLALPSAMPEDIRRRLVKEHLPQDDWSPCGELAAGSVYCAEHQRAKYRRARAHGYLHRRRPLV